MLNTQDYREKILQIKNKRSKIKNNDEILIGKCREFCPQLEIYERKMRNDISEFESEKMVKKYSRSFAGQGKAHPDDFRPLDVLERCFEHLMGLLPTSENIFDLYKFVEDRCRAIRMDLDVQSLQCERSVLLLARISRFYLVFQYLLFEYKEFEEHLNTTQIKRTLMTIIEIVEENTDQIGGLEEIYTYFLILNIDNYEIITKKYYLKENPKMKLVFSLIDAYYSKDYTTFFSVFGEMDFLTSVCVLCIFESLRKKIFATLKKCLKGRFCKKTILDILNLSESEDNYFKREGIEKREGFYIFEGKYEENEIKSSRKMPQIVKEKNQENLFITILDGTFQNSIFQHISDEKIDFNVETVEESLDLSKKFHEEKKEKEPIFVNEEKNENILEEEDRYKLQKTIDEAFKSKLSTYFDVWISKIQMAIKSKILIITDKSVYSNVIRNKFKNHALKPQFTFLNDLTVEKGLEFFTCIFSIDSTDFSAAKKKFYMLNKVFVDRKECYKIKLEKFDMKKKRVVKRKLIGLLLGRRKDERIEILTDLISNKKNLKLEKQLLKVQKDERVDNIDVFCVEDVGFL